MRWTFRLHSILSHEFFIDTTAKVKVETTITKVVPINTKEYILLNNTEESKTAFPERKYSYRSRVGCHMS